MDAHVSQHFDGARPVGANGVAGEIEKDEVKGEGARGGGGWGVRRVASGGMLRHGSATAYPARCSGF